MRFRALTLAAIAATALLLAACPAQGQPAMQTQQPVAVGAHRPGVVQDYLTPDGTGYSITSSGLGSISVAAAPTTGLNTRSIDYSPAGPVHQDATECATWKTGVGQAQDALVFDITHHGGGTQAIAIERNIWMFGFWGFILVTWDTTKSVAIVSEDGLANLSSYLGANPTADVFPLRVCARMVGDRLDFEVAKGADPVPAWGDLHQGGSATLADPSYAVPGYTGVFFGHLPAGSAASDTNITIDGVPAAL